MKTYNDLVALGQNEEARKDFILSAIADHKATPEYKIAKDAEMYMKTLNPTIMEYKKLLYTITGEAVPDNFSANHKCASSFFKRFVTQENQYLLGNGASFGGEDTKERLGGEDFDVQLQKAGRFALVGGLSFGFANLDHIEVFKYTEFKPLWDEEDGALKAGIRYWQVADNKPLRATLYELDGYTEYIKRKDEDLVVLNEKRPYQQIVTTSEVDGTEILEGQNYPTFPIVPLWGNPEHQSELVTIRSQIDAYDLIKCFVIWKFFLSIICLYDCKKKLHNVSCSLFFIDPSSSFNANFFDNCNKSAKYVAYVIANELFDACAIVCSIAGQM